MKDEAKRSGNGHYIMIRLTEAEKREIQRRAEKAGFKATPSVWCRDQLLRLARFAQGN